MKKTLKLSPNYVDSGKNRVVVEMLLFGLFLFLTRFYFFSVVRKDEKIF
jgi:hypothetical protein